MKPQMDKTASPSLHLSILMILCTWDIHGEFSGIAELKQIVTFYDILFISSTGYQKLVCQFLRPLMIIKLQHSQNMLQKIILPEDAWLLS